MHTQNISRWKHAHDFGGESSTAERNTRRVLMLTAVMMVVEIIGGLKLHSMALFADGWHMAIALNMKDGAYGLTADFWDGHVEKEVGKDYGKLLQLYGVHKTAIEARKKGYTVHRQQKQDGSIKLVMMGVGI